MAQQPQRVDDAVLKNAAKNGDQWLMYGRDYSEAHYSPLKQINADNAKQLGLVWYYDTDSEPGTVEGTPIVANGTMYVTVTWGVLSAIDARTGKLKWRWDPKISHHNFPPGSAGKPDKVRTGPSVCCGPVNRGVAIYDGKVYIGTLTGHLVALDAETGKVVWDVVAADENADYSITGAPRIADGKVLIGNAGGEYSVRGYISAYDAETGKLDWRFYTVPGDPSKPFENKAMERAAKTWTGEWYKMGGGGNPWDSITYDPDLDIVYVGVGQGGPWVQKFRSPGGGDNLYICSIVALRGATGQYLWHFQTTPGDEWDYDATQGMVLADLKINGKMRKVLMQAPKNGFFYVLDRKTGKFISGKAIATVTWAKGLDPKTGRPIEESGIRDYVKGVVVSPGPGGAHNWQVMSYNPHTGLVYIPTTDSSFFYLQQPEFKYEIGEYSWGIVFRRPTAPIKAGQPPPATPPTGPPKGYLLAWDPATEAERWRVPEMNGGGTVTTAGNVVFAASADGHFAAFSADKGEKLWETKLFPGFANPATYMLDGKQYVSVLAGRGGKARVYTFALDGKLPIPPNPYAAPRNAAPAPEATHNPNQP
ncbi:MAG TPA: PQQ-dependent dehydrogenase, methanol/ethanol family [Candidatus Polarisedimenticolia bacterium]|nr:PQQ-dependent dehydrogenase, methanol/ethanol family [Candidatus Polarisedimenticolia bacterium]